MRRAIFLDRDGVLNHSETRNRKPYAPSRFKDFKILPGTRDALLSLKGLDFALAVVTNQPDVGNGKIKKEIVEKMHSLLRSTLPIDLIEVCYHSQIDDCLCRKPKPGMILTAAKKLDANLSKSFMIGDRWSDVSAGKAAGCTTIFIDKKYNEKKIDQPDLIVNSLEAAVYNISSNTGIINA
jgi:D-glycero-D-manno-heptose 1,7-bisphosphate phosphatase